MQAFRLLVMAGLSAVASVAQATDIPSSGCPSSGFVNVIGPLQTSTTAIVGWSCQNNIEFPVLVVGTEITPTPLPTALTCGGITCAVACSPVAAFAAVPGQVVVTSIVIPNDPTLVGFCFAAQGACANPAGCLTLSVAKRVCVQ